MLPCWIIDQSVWLTRSVEIENRRALRYYFLATESKSRWSLPAQLLEPSTLAKKNLIYC